MSTEYDPLEPEVLEALARKRKIEAIRILREKRRIGLKEAKDRIDAYLNLNTRSGGGVQRSASSGWLPLLLVLGLLGMVVYLLLT